jgi:hypothetical protein
MRCAGATSMSFGDLLWVPGLCLYAAQCNNYEQDSNHIQSGIKDNQRQLYPDSDIVIDGPVSQ